MSAFLLGDGDERVIEANATNSKTFVGKRKKAPKKKKAPQGGDGGQDVDDKEPDCKKFEVDHADAYRQAKLEVAPFLRGGWRQAGPQ